MLLLVASQQSESLALAWLSEAHILLLLTKEALPAAETCLVIHLRLSEQEWVLHIWLGVRIRTKHQVRIRIMRLDLLPALPTELIDELILLLCQLQLLITKLLLLLLLLFLQVHYGGLLRDFAELRACEAY